MKTKSNFTVKPRALFPSICFLSVCCLKCKPEEAVLSILENKVENQCLVNVSCYFSIEKYFQNTGELESCIRKANTPIAFDKEGRCGSSTKKRNKMDGTAMQAVHFYGCSRTRNQIKLFIGNSGENSYRA